MYIFLAQEMSDSSHQSSVVLIYNHLSSQWIVETQFYIWYPRWHGVGFYHVYALWAFQIYAYAPCGHPSSRPYAQWAFPVVRPCGQPPPFLCPVGISNMHKCHVGTPTRDYAPWAFPNRAHAPRAPQPQPHALWAFPKHHYIACVSPYALWAFPTHECMAYVCPYAPWAFPTCDNALWAPPPPPPPPHFTPCGHSQHFHIPWGHLKLPPVALWAPQTCAYARGHPKLAPYALWAFPTCAHAPWASQHVSLCLGGIPNLYLCPWASPAPPLFSGEHNTLCP